MSSSSSGHKAKRPGSRRSPITSMSESLTAQTAATGVRKHLEPAELRALFRYLPVTSFWYPYFFIQYYYGCRLSEPALLRDGDVDFQQRTITIRRLKRESEEHGYRKFTYPADDRVLTCVQIAQAWRRKMDCDENPFLFASKSRRKTEEVGAERLSKLRNNEGWQAVSRFTAHRTFRQIVKAIRLPEHLQHSGALRHARASLLLALGMPPQRVWDLTGNPTHKAKKRSVKAAESLDDRWRKDPEKEIFLALDNFLAQPTGLDPNASSKKP